METENLNEILIKRREKLQNLIDEGKNPYDVSKYDVTEYSMDIKNNFENYDGKNVSIAGRLMGKRVMGKASFCNVQDMKGNIQCYVARDEIGKEVYQDFKKYDIGDIVGVKGYVFKTKTDEISIHVSSIELLSKSLQILPEKFHGLKDPDLRYRQRYVDLIVNPEVKEVFFKRTKILKSIREYLDNKDFLEVETPILSTVAGGANAKPFYTHQNSLNMDMQMRIANELFLKRLIVGGFDKVYEMGKMFRNEGMDTRHNPEFTNIEIYKAYTNYEEMMEITEEIFENAALTLYGTTKITYQGREIDLKAPWKRMTMVDAVKEVTGVDFNEINTDEEARKIAIEKGLNISEDETRGKIISEMFEEFVEETLIQPTIITKHPVEVSPLSKRSVEDKRFTDRFEAFINSWEFANAFSELNDPIDQKQRFEKQVEEKRKGDEEAHPMDTDFINALEVGLPPTGGLGIGVDRMVMLLTDQPSIRDVVFFPTMKPLNQENNTKEELETAEDNNNIEIDFSKVKVEPLFEEMVDFETFSKSDFRAVKVLNCEEVPKSKKLLKFTLDDGSDKERVILSGIKDNYNAEDLIGKTLLAICNLPPRKMMGIDSEGMIISAIHEEEGKEKLNLVMLSPRIPAGAKMY